MNSLNISSKNESMQNSNNLPLIKRRGMSHSYIKLNNLENYLPHNYEKEKISILKSIIRFIDSTDINKIRKILRNNQVKYFGRKKEEIRNEFIDFILQNVSRLKKLENELFENKNYQLIPSKDRDYDGILGIALNHKNFDKAHKEILKLNKDLKKNIAFLTTCASIKPYSLSPTFKHIFKNIKEKTGIFENIHWLVISNATAPIPEEFHYSYPFFAYETDLNKLNKSEIKIYQEIALKRMKEYFTKFQYDYYIGYLRPNSYQRKVVELLQNEMDIKFKFFPSLDVINKIKKLGMGYWCRKGLVHEYSLEELINYLNSLKISD